MRRLAPLFLALPLAACAEGPDSLKSALQNALDTGNGTAVIALADLKGAPAMAHYLLLSMVDQCSDKKVCKVELTPITPEWEKRSAESAARQGLEPKLKPEGLLRVTGKARDAKPDAKNEMTTTLPYANVDGKYRLVGQHFSAAKRAELEGTTAQAQAEKTLAAGIPDEPGTNERNAQWKSTATALPPGGGEIGKAYLARLGQRAAAAKANDPDAAVAATGQWGEVVLGAKEHDGTPRSMDVRKRKLAAQAPRWEVEAQVLGGWVKDRMAVLVVEGKNGAGNIVRGAQLMEQVNGKWESGAADLLEVPVGG